MLLASKTYDLSDVWAAQELYHANGWTDGLPIVPPTRDAVVACLELAVADPAQLVGVEPVRGVAVTAEKLAINAVMAGCLPTHFLVVLACFAAMLRPEFLLHGATASTGAARFWLH
jgi:trimethylamine:corrinoid methyltransferase-like protein